MSERYRGTVSLLRYQDFLNEIGNFLNQKIHAEKEECYSTVFSIKVITKLKIDAAPHCSIERKKS